VGSSKKAGLTLGIAIKSSNNCSLSVILHQSSWNHYGVEAFDAGASQISTLYFTRRAT
ncbi:MAG: hypothetical protein JWM04_2390, partial [Verrucomicrobiales bacterium]|nr:hypothetical protein [Verrucomicrobiales bacterium]